VNRRPGCALAARYSVRCSLRALAIRRLPRADFCRCRAVPRGGNPAAFPCFDRIEEGAALPSRRLSRRSTVLWYYGHLRPPVRHRLHAFGPRPRASSYQRRPSPPDRTGSLRLSWSTVAACCRPVHRPGGTTHFPLNLVPWQASPLGHRLAPGTDPAPAGGVDDAATAFTWVAARGFASLSDRFTSALSSRFFITSYPMTKGIWLPGERNIARIDTSQSTSQPRHLGRTPQTPRGKGAKGQGVMLSLRESVLATRKPLSTLRLTATFPTRTAERRPQGK
jgi:hypothetical protein